MNLIDYIVLSGILTAVTGVIIWLIRRKKQGKSCCGNCSGRADCTNKH